MVRLSARFDVGSDGRGPTPPELAEALDGLKADLDALVGVPLAAIPAARPDRPLDELVQTYRPRQRELIDLLRDEHELTDGEHARLVGYLSGGADAPRAASPAPPPERYVDRPIAAAPIGVERPSEPTRPVADLLREYQIGSLRQAGAVRGRREISFAEYMALKRHFEQLESGGSKSADAKPA